jgi:23S rRNA pseudouridine1911/1915/1917 synthase
MIAKTDSMMKYLSNTIKERQVDKYYIAIVLGIVKDHDLYIESYIGRDKHNRQKMTGNDPVNPKLAITRAKVLDYIDNKYTLLRVQIETGRTHQIRVHLASIAHPIIGDSVYGNPKANIEAKTRYQLKRQALHASCLELNLYGVRKKFE